jgi:hypothetical protein
VKTDCSPHGAANRGVMRAAGARSIIRNFLRNANLRHLKIAVVIAALALSLFTASLASAALVPIKLRIEGKTHTIFEGTIKTERHVVTTQSGGTHKCDGTNLGANPEPGPTPTAAVDAAATKDGFTWDGSWYEGFEDYFVERIGDSPQEGNAYWGVLVNYEFTPVGGCQQEVGKGEEVLWAWNAFEVSHFLKLKKSKYSTNTVVVTDGLTGEPVENATVGPVNNGPGVTTNAAGEATLSFPTAGKHRVKAEQSDSIRSNSLVIKTR